MLKKVKNNMKYSIQQQAQKSTVSSNHTEITTSDSADILGKDHAKDFSMPTKTDDKCSISFNPTCGD